MLYLIASGKAGFELADGFASDGYGDHSLGGYSTLASLITDVVMIMIFLHIICGATDDPLPKGFAPIAIQLGLRLIHLISIPVASTSVNPARSAAVAVSVGGWAVFYRAYPWAPPSLIEAGRLRLLEWYTTA